MTRRLWTLLAALGAFLALAQPALADDPGAGNGNGGDNVVVAQNTTDGSSLFRFAFAVRRVVGDVVDNTNAAVAYSSCTDCRTTAIAIQILLVEGSPSTYTPQNIAIAVNENCSACQTFASAYQFVVQTQGPVRFTGDGMRQLWQIRKAIKDMEDQNLSPADMDAQLQQLMAQLQTVLQTQLVPAGDETDHEQERGPPDRRGNSETATAPTTTTSTTTAPTTTAAPPATTTAPATSTTTTPSTTTPPSTSTSTTTTTAPTTTDATTTTTP